MSYLQELAAIVVCHRRRPPPSWTRTPPSQTRSRDGGARHTGSGFVTIPGTLNAVDAWLSSLPGNNVRQPIVSTLNLAHMMLLSAVWASPQKNEHLDGPPGIVTSHRWRYRHSDFVTHTGGRGAHGRGRPLTGMGKSAFSRVGDAACRYARVCASS